MSHVRPSVSAAVLAAGIRMEGQGIKVRLPAEAESLVQIPTFRRHLQPPPSGRNMKASVYKTIRYHIPEDSSKLALLHSVQAGPGAYTATYQTFRRGLERPRRETYVRNLCPPPSCMTLPRSQSSDDAFNDTH
jgi:hypothetical protein